MLVVEDVQWADSSSLGLLAYLVRRLADWPLLLVLSWQAEQGGRLRVLRTALSEAEDQSLGEMIEPGLLGPEAISALLDLDGMPRVEVDRLMAETRGLPMLVREYIEARRSAGDEPGGQGPETADWWPPASVRDLLRARLQAVSEPTRQMLTAAAVLGSDNDTDLLRAVSGRGEDEIVEAIDEALARSLLTEIPPPAAGEAPSYGFPYEALRRTAYESATLARRRLLHGRAADILTRRYERDPATTRAATVADHLQLAGRDAEAAQWWWRAAQVARELYAQAEAYAHLVRALALGYPQLAGRIALGEVLVVLGRYREALAEFETAAALAGAGAKGPAPATGQTTPRSAPQMATAPCRPASSTSWPTCTIGWATGTWPRRTSPWSPSWSPRPSRVAWPGPRPTGRWSRTGGATWSRRPPSARPRCPAPGPPPTAARRRRPSTCSACWPRGSGTPPRPRPTCATAWPRPASCPNSVRR